MCHWKERPNLLEMSFSFIPSVCALISPSTAKGQTLSAKAILAQVGQRVGAVTHYQAFLNDTNTHRPIAAMEVMSSSGSAKLSRVALEFGIYSPNPLI
jgi:hypothetical protein